jgi:hypothetical protein
VNALRDEEIRELSDRNHLRSMQMLDSRGPAYPLSYVREQLYNSISKFSERIDDIAAGSGHEWLGRR